MRILVPTLKEMKVFAKVLSDFGDVKGAGGGSSWKFSENRLFSCFC